jgi:hypothetical protein
MQWHYIHAGFGAIAILESSIDLNPILELFTIMYEELDEDLPLIFQAMQEDERRKRYLREIGDWLVDEYFEPNIAS